MTGKKRGGGKAAAGGETPGRGRRGWRDRKRGKSVHICVATTNGAGDGRQKREGAGHRGTTRSTSLALTIVRHMVVPGKEVRYSAVQWDVPGQWQGGGDAEVGPQKA